LQRALVEQGQQIGHPIGPRHRGRQMFQPIHAAHESELYAAFCQGCIRSSADVAGEEQQT
jgi:hypothetical protein